MKSITCIGTLLALFITLAHSAPDDVEKLGSKRGKPPNGWAQFAWPEMKAVLFGPFAPTPEEKELIEKALPAKPATQPSEPRKVLLFYRCTYPHASIATGTFALLRMGEASGAFSVDLSDDPADFSPANLATYDAVLLVNTVGYEKIIGPDGCAALLEFVKSGKGLIGIHAAADACKGWKEGAEMMGGVFQCHPWLPKGTWAFELESPEHPINQAFDGKGFWLRDEIYYYRAGSHSRGRSRDLVGLDMSKDHNHEAKELNQDIKHLATTDEAHPVSWIHPFGKGRVFYCNFGHNNTTYWQKNVLQHYLDGIRFALGDLDADATPSEEIPKVKTAPAPPQR